MARRKASLAERVIGVVAGVLSAVVLVALVASSPPSAGTGEPAPTQEVAAPTPERGDPVLAQRLAEQARQVSGSDPRAELRLLLAAHVAAPDRAAHRIALARVMLGSAEPVRLIQTTLDAGGPNSFAALSSDGSFMVTDGGAGGQLWQTGWIANPPRVLLATGLETAVSGAAGAGTLTRSTVVVAAEDGVHAWRAASPASARRLGQLAAHAAIVAVTRDGITAVTVQATEATLSDVGGPRPAARATLSYDRPVTTVAFSPGSAVVLAAGHADGGVTVHTIDLDIARTTRRTLTGGGGPVAAVAVSADASTVLAAHQDGTLSVWDLRAGAPEPIGTATAAAGAGPHRVWLSAAGDYAFVADAAGAPALWSLAERARPTQMLVLGLGADPAVPAMISADGRTVATIDRANTLALWDMKAIVEVLADPVGRACQLADMTEQRWRQLVADEAFANPCAPSALPSLGVEDD